MVALLCRASGRGNVDCPLFLQASFSVRALVLNGACSRGPKCGADPLLPTPPSTIGWRTPILSRAYSNTSGQTTFATWTTSMFGSFGCNHAHERA